MTQQKIEEIPEKVISNIIHWINANLEEPLKIEDVSRRSGYSKWHLQRLFLKYTGENLGSYIRTRRLRCAALDLIETSESVMDICQRYGFDSQQTFTRIFTRTYLQPPGAYRRSRMKK